MTQSRIIRNKRILGGKPVIEGTRISVSAVLDQLKNGHGTGKHVREMYPQLSERQIDAAIEFASKKIEQLH